MIEIDNSFTSYVEEKESSVRGKIIADLFYHITNNMKIGKKIKSGELRKKIGHVEPEWKVPEAYNMTHINLKKFSMKFLLPKKNPNMKKVILQLHGGGYVSTIRNAYYSCAVWYSQAAHGCGVLTPDYRVAPEYPYPAALEDAVTCYKWLLEKGYSAEQIIIGGDSAGGGLAMALTMYLRNHQMPLPCAIIAMSPWTDLTGSGASYKDNVEIDPVFGSRPEVVIGSSYVGGDRADNPYISPMFGDFTDFPKLLIQVGTEEMLLSDSQTVRDKAVAAGVDVRYSEYKGMFHVFQMAGKLIPESKRAWEEIKSFIDEL